jgi:hypothetical protein
MVLPKRWVGFGVPLGRSLVGFKGVLGQKKNNMAPRKITFKYRDASSFRALRASGVLGGPTPTGEIYMGFYTQRPPTPETTFLNLDQHGRAVGAEDMSGIEQDTLIREMEIGITLDLSTAVAIRTWLDGHIKSIQDTITQHKAISSLLEGKKQ